MPIDCLLFLACVLIQCLVVATLIATLYHITCRVAMLLYVTAKKRLGRRPPIESHDREKRTAESKFTQIKDFA